MTEQVQQSMYPAPGAGALSIASYLKGGIGNQLFQHVFARGLANKLGAELTYDVSFFDVDPYNNQSVLKWFAPRAQLTEIAKIGGPGAYVLGEGVMGSLHDVLQLPGDARVLVLNGYWQDERLLDRAVVEQTYAEIAHHLDAYRTSPAGQDIEANTNSIAVHLRRRDYGHMGICEESYYIGAIDFLRKRYPAARLFVFTDEPNYAQQLLGGRYPGLAMVSSGGDLSDLYLMSLCKHFVIANSSYSWWAAYFGESKGGMIICPDEWVMQPGLVSPCPTRWIRVRHAVRPMQVDPEAAGAVERDIGAQLAALAERSQRQP